MLTRMPHAPDLTKSLCCFLFSLVFIILKCFFNILFPTNYNAEIP